MSASELSACELSPGNIVVSSVAFCSCILGLCIDAKERMKAHPTDSEYEETILRIYDRAERSQVSVIIIFGTHAVIRNLLKAASKHASRAPRRFTWFGSDGWSNTLELVGAEADPALGALTIMMIKGDIPQTFKDYFSSFNLTNYPRTNKRYVDFCRTKKVCETDHAWEGSGIVNS